MKIADQDLIQAIRNEKYKEAEITYIVTGDATQLKLAWRKPGFTEAEIIGMLEIDFIKTKKAA